MDHKQPAPPRNLTGYFEALNRIVFQSGMTWRVVEAKWPGIRAGFQELEPERVARMTARDIDRLSKDARVIRNVAKIEATVLNAREMVALEKAPVDSRSICGRWIALRKRARRFESGSSSSEITVPTTFCGRWGRRSRHGRSGAAPLAGSPQLAPRNPGEVIGR